MGEIIVEKALGRAIQSARQVAGFTQQELCQKANISYSTLAKIERGVIRTPSVFTVQSIAQVLNIGIDELLGTANSTEAPNKINKKISKSGVSFLYLDINGCLVRFFHGAFTLLANDTGISSDVIESTFWHYNDAVCRGEMSLVTLNSKLAKKFAQDSVDWKYYYMRAVEPIEEMHDLVKWATKHYKVGLLSNIMPGFIDEMIQNGILPNIKYDTIIDSSQVGLIKPEREIYEIAENKANVPSEQILFVDDSSTNLMSAERLGWKVLSFDDYQPAESAKKIRSALNF